MRRLWDIAAALAVIVSSIACTDSTGRNAPSTEPVTPSSPCPSDHTCHVVVGTDPAIVVYKGPFYSNLMPLTARLKWVENESCLVVHRQDEPGNRLRMFFPVWPEGTRPVHAPDGRRGIEHPQAGRILDGDLFQAGGSDYALNVSPPIPDIPTFSRPPGACSTYDGYFITSARGINRLEE